MARFRADSYPRNILRSLYARETEQISWKTAENTARDLEKRIDQFLPRVSEASGLTNRTKPMLTVIINGKEVQPVTSEEITPPLRSKIQSISAEQVKGIPAIVDPVSDLETGKFFLLINGPELAKLTEAENSEALMDELAAYLATQQLQYQQPNSKLTNKIRDSFLVRSPHEAHDSQRALNKIMGLLGTHASITAQAVTASKVTTHQITNDLPTDNRYIRDGSTFATQIANRRLGGQLVLNRVVAEVIEGNVSVPPLHDSPTMWLRQRRNKIPTGARLLAHQLFSRPTTPQPQRRQS